MNISRVYHDIPQDSTLAAEESSHPPLPHREVLTIKVWRTRTPFLVRHPWILDWLESRRSITGSERGSDWEPIKIILQRENSAYAPNSQARVPTRVCQGHIVTTDLPTLGTNPKLSRSESETQEVKNLAALRSTRRTANKHRRTIREA
jgi:hypothetical protein